MTRARLQRRTRATLSTLGLLICACSTSTTTSRDAVSASTNNSISATVIGSTTVDTSTLSSNTDHLADCLTTWPLRERIALLVWPGAYSDQWGDVEAAVRDLHVGGVVLMQLDDTFVLNLGTHLNALDQLSANGLLVATDEEGGDVQRLRALGAFASEHDMSSLAAEDRAIILDRHAQVIAAAGVDVVLGPVVDVRPLIGSDPLGDERLFIGDPQQVAALGGEYVAAWQRAGMLPVLKHFPGHGSASDDTHDLLATTPLLDVLGAYDLVPFQQLASSGAAVMVGHLSVPGLTDDQPASMHPAAITLLREMGYADTLVVSDALGMDAVGVPVPDAAVLSVQAGVDVVLFTGISDARAVIDAIELAVNDGRIAVADIDDSALRVARLLESRGRPCAVAS